MRAAPDARACDAWRAQDREDLDTAIELGADWIALSFVQKPDDIRELRRLIYPNGVFALRFGRQSIPDRVLQAVWGFVGVYITISVIFTLLFTMTGMDLATAVSAVAASLNNLGVGIGQVGGGFANITDSAKWMMTVLMVAGRLEIFTLLVLFTPMFWKQ